MRDYKPVSAKAQPRARWLVWFIAGLGLPLITVALISPDNSQPPQLEALTTVATVKAIPDETPEIIAPAPATPAKPKYSGEIPALVAAPEPEYERTVMTVKNGDSLDRLFQRRQGDQVLWVFFGKIEEPPSTGSLSNQVPVANQRCSTG